MPESPPCLLLSTSYFPPLPYFRLIAKYRNIRIEMHENYNKQSYRNRCNILSSNGILSLVVPVKRFKGRKTPIKDIKPDYDSNWQKLHRISVESAYRSAPFFEYYIDDIMPFLKTRYKFLIDLNSEILLKMLAILNIEAITGFSKTYIDKPVDGIVNMREQIHPKRELPLGAEDAYQIRYNQVFEQRSGFKPGLSILDILFNAGPDAGSLITRT